MQLLDHSAVENLFIPGLQKENLNRVQIIRQDPPIGRDVLEVYTWHLILRGHNPDIPHQIAPSVRGVHIRKDR